MGEPGLQSVQDVEVIRPSAGVAVVELHGEHDFGTAGQVRALLRELMTENPLVIVDVSEAGFIDSSVLHNMLNADRQAKASGHRFVLQMGTRPIVRLALEVSGLLDYLDCASSREEALSQPTR